MRDRQARGTVSGELELTIGKQVHTLPFSMPGSRLRIATVDVKLASRLVPLSQ